MFLFRRSAIDISVLFNENSEDEYIVLLTSSKKVTIRDLLVEELRRHGFSICVSRSRERSFRNIVRLRHSIKLHNLKTTERTPRQLIDPDEIVGGQRYKAIFFKTNWGSAEIGLKISRERTRIEQNESESSRRWVRSGHIVVIERKNIQHSKSSQLGLNVKTEVATSGYGTKSSSSRLLEKVKRGAASSSGLQTMFSGPEERMTGQDLLDEVQRAVALQLTITGSEGQSKGKYDHVQAWVDSSERKTTVPNIYSTEAFDRELGNIAETSVGSEGGAISLRSYQIQIPSNTVKTETNFKFRVSVEMDLLEYPQHLIPISLPLYCSPNVDFSAPVSFKLPTWARKTDLSPNSDPVPVYVYTKRKDDDWVCTAESELTPSGNVEFKCEHFCVNSAFINQSDSERVSFALEHILLRDNDGNYTTWHYLSSEALANAMLEICSKHEYKILHLPTYRSLAKHGDEIRVDLISKNPDIYTFESEGDCVLKIDEEFYRMNRSESFSFVLTPENIPTPSIDFTYIIGEKKFLKRDKLSEPAPQDVRTQASTATDGASGGSDISGAAANIIVHGTANITQTGVTNVVMGGSREPTNFASTAVETAMQEEDEKAELTEQVLEETVEEETLVVEENGENLKAATVEPSEQENIRQIKDAETTEKMEKDQEATPVQQSEQGKTEDETALGSLKISGDDETTIEQTEKGGV